MKTLSALSTILLPGTLLIFNVVAQLDENDQYSEDNLVKPESSVEEKTEILLNCLVENRPTRYYH
ncbi:Bifunctional protein GlmU [Frankliniella fusca]|uniref:Bifunctional protein GlmU n=1 Tax=Frankliniella fusca TaxID=407009 RepID=A0AAE1GXK1_9NEOP|nr:Bifunctional protein GlmU [Frankliniella fusca]